MGQRRPTWSVLSETVWLREGERSMEYVSCGLCGADSSREAFRQVDLTHHVTDEEFTVVRCEVCGLLYLNPRPTQEEIGRYYPTPYFGTPSRPRRFSRVKRWIMEDFYSYPSAAGPGPWRLLRKVFLWPEHQRRLAAGNLVLPWVGRGRLLDVGCGSGSSTVIFQIQGWDVTGLDLNEVAIAHAKSLIGDRAQLGDIMTMHYPDQHFDVVRLSHSLEHIYGLSAVLAEAKRILDDQGMLVVAVPNAGSLEARLFGRWWFPWELPRHLHHFTRRTLARLLEQAGFRVIKIRTGVTAAHFMTSLERVWMHKFGRALPARKWIEKLFVRPFCLLVGNLGYGTEVTVYAVKAQPDPRVCEADRSVGI